MNNIQIFNNPDFGEIRTVVIDNEPWFVGVDVAKALGYKKPTGAVTNNVDKDDTLTEGVTDSMGRVQNTLVVNESGLYSLIFNSKLEGAKKFKKWVTSEVLPSIRKTGQYGQARLPMTIPEQIQIIAQGYGELHEEVKTIKEEMQDLKDNMPILPIEAEKITNSAKAKGVHVMGGKSSNAYANRSIVNAVYRDIYGQVYRNFGVKSYKAIKRNQTDKAIAVIEAYAPPIILQDRIDNENAQQRLDV